MPTNKKYIDYLVNPSEKTLFLRPATFDETEDIIKTLSVYKSLGPNSIPTKLLQQFSKSISISLSSLINLSFKNGVFPNALKLASAISVFKKGDYLQCNNYRSISLTSNISKKTKKLVHQRLYLFLKQNNILYNNQYGFRNKHCTNLSLVDITEKLRKVLDSKHYARGVNISLHQAFDTVNHSILLNKLSYYGVRGQTNKWFENFIPKRYQYTSIKECSSEKLKTTLGSVLRSFLFLLYINDQHKSIEQFCTPLC